jgi:diguanylate cyclase (GGDEF)-like protein/PAS domain S-box-containing protein
VAEAAGDLIVAHHAAERRAALVDALARAGAPARPAASLAEVLRMVAQAPPAVVVASLRLEDHDGVATVHVLGDAAAGIPVVALARDGYEAGLALAAGAEDAVVVEEDETAAVERVLAVRRRVRSGQHADLGRFFAIADGLFLVLDRDGAVVRSNPAVTRRLGWGHAELRDLPLDRRLHPDDVEGAAAAIARAATGTAEVVRARHATDDGQWRDVDWALSGDAATGLVYAVGTDVTEAVRAAEALESTAHTDALTGLANRAGALRALRQRVREGRETAVLYCDLDGFKHVNDTYGHSHGDRVLAAAAGRLSSRVRSSDLAARIGGDEFVVITTPGRGAEQLAARLVEGFGRPIGIDGVHTRLGLSVGIAIAPGGGADVAAVIDAADRAMYAAKQAGGDTWRSEQGA